MMEAEGGRREGGEGVSEGDKEREGKGVRRGKGRGEGTTVEEREIERWRRRK